MSLDISKNLIVHFFVTRAMIATPLLHSGDETGLTPQRLGDRAQALSRLFKHEFQFRADASHETIFFQTLEAMEADGEIVVDRSSGNPDTELIRIAPNGEGRERAILHARMILAFVEGYRVAARACSALLKGPLAPKDLAKRAMTAGERMFLAGEISCREAVSRPVVENAFLAFVDQGYLSRADGKYSLPDSYASADAVSVIESRVTSFLPST